MLVTPTSVVSALDNRPSVPEDGDTSRNLHQGRGQVLNCESPRKRKGLDPEFFEFGSRPPYNDAATLAA